MADDANVKVFCRVRPPNERERANTNTFLKKCVVVPLTDPLQQTVLLQSRHAAASGAPPKTFTFDRAFSERATQTDVFDTVAVPITRACLQGYNGTIFAYGQTGSGKTFTMQGPDHVIDVAAAHRALPHDAALRGLVPRVFDFLFADRTASDSESNSTVTHTFACSYLEIYNERVFDLLDQSSSSSSTANNNTSGLALRENGRKGVFVDGLIEMVVTSAAQAAQLMTLGAQNRRVGQTAMNRESSRSHSVFIVQIASTETTADGITNVRTSRFNLVDLAGSERQRSTEAAGERLKEAGSINKSLSALGNVIMGLVEQSAGKNRHVHYRDSKLTFLLKDSLGGNAKTVMIATIAPGDDSVYETLSTLKFAQRAKLIQNNAVINEDASGSVAVLQDEIQRLRQQLALATHQHAPSAIARTVSESELLSRTQNQTQNANLMSFGDPVVDQRFRALEAAFAATVAKHTTLKRSHERLQVHDTQIKTLCVELKRHVAQLRLALRLQRAANPLDSVALSKVIDYEPSVDAIEWRVKYDELEESFVELQDEVQRQRLLDPTDRANANRRDALEGDVEQLNLLLLTLTTQLAHVVQDKHALQDRLLRLTASSDDANDVEMDDGSDKSTLSERLKHEAAIADLQQQIETQAIDAQAHVATAHAARDAAFAAAHDASRLLVDAQQQHAAYELVEIDHKQQLVAFEQRLTAAIDAQQQAEAALVAAQAQHEAEATAATRTHDTMALEANKRIVDLQAHAAAIQQQLTTMEQDAQALDAARVALEQHVATLTIEVAERTAERTAAQNTVHEQLVTIESLTHARLRLETTLQDARRTIAEREQRIMTLQHEMDAQKATQTVLQQQLDDKTQALDAVERQQHATDAALAAAIAANTQLTNDKIETAKQLETTTEAFATAQRRIAEVEAQVMTATDKIAALQAAETTLQQTNADLRDALNARDEALVAATNEREAIAAAHAHDLQQRKEAFSVQCNALVAQHEAARMENAEQLTQQRNAIESMEQEHKEAIAALTRDAVAERKAAADELTTTTLRFEQQLAERDESLTTAQLRVEALTQQFATANADVQQLEAARQVLEATRNEQQQALAVRDDTIVGLQTTQTELTTRCEALETELQAQTATHHALETSFAALEAARDALEVDNAAHKQRADALAAETTTLAAAVDAATKREQSLTDALASAKKELEDATQTHEDAIATLQQTHDAALQQAHDAGATATSTFETELQTSRDVLEALRTVVAARDAALETLTAANATLEQDAAAAATAAAATLQQRDATHQAAAADAERLVSSQRAELQAFAASAAALKTESKTLAKKLASNEAAHAAALTAARDRATELATQLDDATAQRTAADARIAALEAQLATAVATTHSSDERNAATTDKLETVTAARAALETRHAALQHVVHDLQSECTRHGDLVARTAALAATRKQLDADQQELNAAAASAAAVREQLEVVTAERDASAAKLATLEPTIAHLQRENAALEAAAAASSAKLASVSRDNDALVGHTNKRQKIQYHFRVKEENNRLMAEVRQLTDDKFRLETKLEKLRRQVSDQRSSVTAQSTASSAAKRANVSVNVVNPVSRSADLSSSGGGIVKTKGVKLGMTAPTMLAGTKRLVPVVGGSAAGGGGGLGGLESSSRAAVDDRLPKKRQHSRIERSWATQ